MKNLIFAFKCLKYGFSKKKKKSVHLREVLAWAEKPVYLPGTLPGRLYSVCHPAFVRKKKSGQLPSPQAVSQWHARTAKNQTDRGVHPYLQDKHFSLCRKLPKRHAQLSHWVLQQLLIWQKRMYSKQPTGGDGGDGMDGKKASATQIPNRNTEWSAKEAYCLPLGSLASLHNHFLVPNPVPLSITLPPPQLT